MQARTIRFVSGLKPVRPLLPPLGGALWENYYPARRTLPPRNQGGAAHGGAPAQHTTNIVNNLRFVNNLRLNVSLRADGARARALPPEGGIKTVAAFAGAAIDAALRGELDRELALMRRGENIGANQRRRAMLGRYLLEKPRRVIRDFYTARMRPAPADAAPDAREDDGFHDDIIRERHTKETHVSYEQHNIREIRQEGAGRGAQTESARRIADEVFGRVERKLRLERERAGLPR